MPAVRRVSALCLASMLLCVACVTVNVYFPTKEAKEGVESLERELLKPSPTTPPSPPPKPQSLREPGVRPALLEKVLWILATTAWAQGDLSQRIREELRAMPEVVEAYNRMKQRLQEIDRMRSQGLVGEGKDGKLTPRVDRSRLSAADLALVDQENRDRDIVISGIAKSVLKINGVEASGGNLDRARPQAGELFANIRRDRAEPGWWIQLPDGTWRKK